MTRSQTIIGIVCLLLGTALGYTRGNYDGDERGYQRGKRDADRCRVTYSGSPAVLGENGLWTATGNVCVCVEDMPK